MCTCLGLAQSDIKFESTTKVYIFVPDKMKLKKHLTLNDPLPKLEGWELFNKRECVTCKKMKLREQFTQKQWKLPSSNGDCLT